MINDFNLSKTQAKDSHRPIIVFYLRDFTSATCSKLDPFESIFFPLVVQDSEGVPMTAARGDLHEF